MLETEKLDDLSCLLKEMTRPGISHPQFARLLTMERLLICSVIGLLLLVLMLFHLAAWWRPEVTPSEFDDALLVIACLFAILLLVLLMTPLAYFLYSVWHRKQLASYISTSLENALHRDAEFITQLWKFDKATLAYGLLQYRYGQSSSERFATAFIGDLRKLGLLPACLALFISLGSIATLFKGDKNSFFLLLAEFSLGLVFLYVMAFLGFLFHERRQQVIQLLEYAIQHADQGNANPPETNTSSPSV